MGTRVILATFHPPWSIIRIPCVSMGRFLSARTGHLRGHNGLCIFVGIFKDLVSRYPYRGKCYHSNFAVGNYSICYWDLN